MKQIIDNVLYDTDKSKLIYSYGISTVYKTNKNKFFIVTKKKKLKSIK